MRLDKTNILDESPRVPTNYDFQKILHARRDERFYKQEDLYLFHRLEAGVRGEETVVEYLKKYGHEHWVVIQNLWLDYYGTYESDIILITRTNCYVFEVKNYEGVLTYKSGICKLNDRILANDCVAQASRAQINLENLCIEASLNLQPKGILIFIGENNWVDINTKVEGLDILMRNQLKYYIQKLVDEEKESLDNFDNQKLIEKFQEYKTKNPFLPKPIEEQELSKVRKGIYCIKCGNFQVNIRRKYIICSCGMYESREEAIIRTICEYGVLNFDKALTTGKLLDFLNNQISRTNLLKVLKENFEMVYNSKYTYYLNKKLPYHKISREFHISCYSKYYATNKNDIHV